VDTQIAEGVAIDIVANGERLVVRNSRAQDVLVLDTTMEPRRENEPAGVLTLTYVRPGAEVGRDGSGDEPLIFDAVLVEANGTASIDPPFAVYEGDRMRYCLEVIEAAARMGGGGTRVGDRDPGEPASLACSDAHTVR
jgi:hypothetical protein